MISIISGLVVTGAGVGTLWYCLPTKGVPAAITRKPMLDTIIPIVIVSALSIGVALIIAGFVNK